jgi:hypothetical protein
MAILTETFFVASRPVETMGYLTESDSGCGLELEDG